MRARTFIVLDSARLRNPAWNEAQLPLHATDEHLLLDLQRIRGDGEIVDRHASRIEDVTTVYVQCANNDSAGDLMEAWEPHLPKLLSPSSS